MTALFKLQQDLTASNCDDRAFLGGPHNAAGNGSDRPGKDIIGGDLLANFSLNQAVRLFRGNSEPARNIYQQVFTGQPGFSDYIGRSHFLIGAYQHLPGNRQQPLTSDIGQRNDVDHRCKHSITLS